MNALEPLRTTIPDVAKDIKLNLKAVFEGSSLNTAQQLGVALAAAHTARHEGLRTALVAEAQAQGHEAVIADAQAAAVLMAMNNVFYRFRHQIGNPAYADLPARLRMNRLAQPSSNKIDLELFSLAVSAINGCEACVRAHEKVVLDGGLTPAQINDAVRIASTINAAALALSFG